jgi:hypothetical protein
MKNVIILFSLFLISQNVIAQNFLEGYQLFSKNKEGYFTLQSGEEITGFVESITRKKGLIRDIKIKTADGKKQVLKAMDIKSMFLAPSGFEKFGKATDKLSDATQWNKDRSAHDAYVKEGYVYFENCEVVLKKGTEMLLMQLVNPGFASKIKVFYDPYARETASIGVGGMTVAGGIAKSYYVQYGNNKAYKLLSKDYKDEWSKLYNNCSELNKEFATKKEWKYFENHVHFYDTKCQ